jgi:lipoprotein-anchoring transpeptidase ErfK/SrfK
MEGNVSYQIFFMLPMALLALGAGSRRQPALDPRLVNDPGLIEIVARGSSEAALRAQILLARAHFSCGEIDGIYGEKLRKAAASFQRRQSLRADGIITHATWEQLNGDGEPALICYTLTPEDVAGPFQKIPEDMMEKAKLPALSYESPLEGIAEKFHTSPVLLTRLNPESTFDRVGEELWVPNIFAPPPGKAALVVIDGSAFTVTTLDSRGQIMTHYPATVGSQHDPLPVGRWKILGVSRNPIFKYSPDLFWDADPGHAKATIAPGPNSPVGVVWIDLSKPHYGIHGTPEPALIGRVQSHGCIRLTNWDASELASMVSPGTEALLKK